MEHPAEVGSTLGFWLIFPKQIGQVAAGKRLVVGSQVTKQGQGLARLEAMYRRSGPFYLHRPQQR
jgi:hypothetical protein